MAKAVKKISKNRAAEFIVRLTSVENASWQGKVEHLQSGQLQYFNSFLALILFINEKIEAVGYPQSVTELRCWDENMRPFAFRGETGTEGAGDQSGLLPGGGCPFWISVQYRQNATWQGTSQCLDRKKTIPFHSLLELISILGDAIREKMGNKGDARLWCERETC